MSGSNDNQNLLRAYGNWHGPIHIPLLSPEQQMRVPEGALPGQSIFDAMSPEEQFWFQHLMGQGVGQPLPRGQVDPYWMMMMQGPQGAVQASGAEGEQGF